MNISRAKIILCCLFIVILAGQVGNAKAADEGTITSVTLAPDATGLVIQHDGRIGSYSSFIMQNPFRLVLDVKQAQLAKIPAKIPVYWARINEIRLGYADSRTRVVVDFGKNPVPPFKIEPGRRVIRVSWGSGMASQSESPARSERPKERKHLMAKKNPSQAPQTKPEAVVRVKSSRVDKNRVLLELADKRHPGKTYTLAVELDGKDLNVRGATLRDSRGMVKRFQLATVKDGIPGVEVETVQPWDRMGGKAQDSGQKGDGKPQFKWGLQSAQDAERTLSGPTKKGAMRMEGFVLKTRTEE